MTRIVEGSPAGAGLRVGIAAARWNQEITDRLVEGALRRLEEMGVEEVTLVRVPGALEIPLALQWLAQSGRFDCLAAIGCVVRGDTYHFEIVASESARGVMDVALEFGIPVANGILTTDTEAQAEARLDKGAEAVRVAVEMARLRAGIADASR